MRILEQVAHLCIFFQDKPSLACIREKEYGTKDTEENQVWKLNPYTFKKK